MDGCLKGSKLVQHDQCYHLLYFKLTTFMSKRSTLPTIHHRSFADTLVRGSGALSSWHLMRLQVTCKIHVWRRLRGSNFHFIFKSHSFFFPSQLSNSMLSSGIGSRPPPPTKGQVIIDNGWTDE